MRELRLSVKIGKRTTRIPAPGGGSSSEFLRHDDGPIAALAIPAPGFCTPHRRIVALKTGGAGAIPMAR